MNQLTNPSCPEAALLDLGGRPSLEWLHFTIEELTPLRLVHGNGMGNGTSSLFIKWASHIGWPLKTIGAYLGGNVNKRSLTNSIVQVDKNESHLITEVDVYFERTLA